MVSWYRRGGRGGGGVSRGFADDGIDIWGEISGACGDRRFLVILYRKSLLRSAASDGEPAFCGFKVDDDAESQLRPPLEP